LDNSIQHIIAGGDLSRIPDIVKTSLMNQNIRADLYSDQKTKFHLSGVLARRAVEKLIEI
jgi:hypothetical protein